MTRMNQTRMTSELSSGTHGAHKCGAYRGHECGHGRDLSIDMEQHLAIRLVLPISNSNFWAFGDPIPSNTLLADDLSSHVAIESSLSSCTCG